VLAAWGPRVRRASGRGDASLFDVAPTVLALLGLPRDSKMAGRVLRDWFEEVPTAPPSRGPVSVAVRRVAARETSPREAEEYAKKLLALGYLSPRETAALAPTGGSRPGRTEGAWNNLGVYERDTRKNPAAARVAFEKALALRPDYYSPMFNLAVLERSAGHARAAEDRLIRSLKGAGGDPAPVLEAWAAEYEQGGRSSAAESLLARAVREWPDSEPVARDLGLVRFRAGDCRGAVAALARYETETREPRTLNALALFQTCLRDRAAVVRLLERSLAVKPDQPEVARSLARARGN
jgi:Flp pilus assembly protein TadD